MKRAIPFTIQDIKQLEKQGYSTPFYIYDENAIVENVKRLNKAFDWVEAGGYKNYFAVKANPNPKILQILKSQGMGADTSSYPELLIAKKVGLKGEEIMFTSNNTPACEFEQAKKQKAIINFDDITHIEFFKKNVGDLPELVSLRYNPGPLKKGNKIIGDPVEAKFGIPHNQIINAYKLLKQEGVKRFGLHTMVVSNMLDIEYLADTASMLFDLVDKVYNELGIKIEFVNLGGGIGIPYKPEQKPVNIEKLSAKIKKLYQEKITKKGLAPLRIVSENGRYVLGPYGYLVTKVRHVFRKYKDYVGVDATMADLMRPGMYGAYHHIEVLGKQHKRKTKTYDVVGSLCENNDKFAIDRKLPEIEPDDYLVIFDAGAHSHAMGFNYNGKLRPAEFIKRSSGKFELIRRAETVKDYFKTLV